MRAATWNGLLPAKARIHLSRRGAASKRSGITAVVWDGAAFLNVVGVMARDGSVLSRERGIGGKVGR